MTTNGIVQVIKQNSMDCLVTSMKAAAFTQICKMNTARTYLSDTAKVAAASLADVTIDHARMPGFFKYKDASAIMAFAAGNPTATAEGAEKISKKSNTLSTVADAGPVAGGKMGLRYAVPSGSTPLSTEAQSTMAIVTRFINRSMNEYREAFLALRESSIKDLSNAQARLISAEEDVINDSEVYLAGRNGLAAAGFDVSNFDRNAEQNSLLVLAVRRLELDPNLEYSHVLTGISKEAKRTKPAASSMTLS